VLLGLSSPIHLCILQGVLSTSDLLALWEFGKKIIRKSREENSRKIKGIE
jgi:hypothetical protein